MSRHHWNDDIKIIKILNINKKKFRLWKKLTNPKVKERAEIDLVKGHGLFSTKWKGWNIISLFIFH